MHRHLNQQAGRLQVQIPTTPNPDVIPQLGWSNPSQPPALLAQNRKPSFSYKRRKESQSDQQVSGQGCRQQRRPASLLCLPTEILDQIIGYLSGSTSKIIYVTRAPGSHDFEPTDLHDGAIRRKWAAHGYPHALFLVNRRISEIAFARVWSDTAVILSLSATDALCFLKYALSERQRTALRRIRFTRFMLSWEDAVGDDIWLSEWKRAPAFFAEVAVSPGAPRVNVLVKHLQVQYGGMPWIQC